MIDSMRTLLISDFNLETFAAYLENDPGEPEIDPTVASFGQVVQTLVDAAAWSDQEAAIVWTQPHAVIGSFNAAQRFERVDPEQALAEVADFGQLLLTAADRVKALFVPTWEIPAGEGGYGFLEMRPGVGVAHLLMRMNLKLAEIASSKSNIYVLPAKKWIDGKAAFNAKLWYMAKSPFAPEVFKNAARDVKAAIRALHGGARKLLVLDLDDTLWGGIVGDQGWQNLTLGGHDPIGEAFVDFQTALKSLVNRGVLLGVVSKNTESIALEAIERHPAMVLRRDDFAHLKINWEDKAKNLVELAAELNLGLQSVVFIDDNPAERARIRDTLPEVFVPDWPQDKTLYRSALLALDCFHQPVMTEEDARRTRLYRDEQRREQAKTQVGSLDDWLKSLDMQVVVQPLTPANLARATQLLNKTNQMNLATRRLTEAELQQWADDPNHVLWTVNVADKFGDAGLTGILSVALEDEAVRIVDFILSCRVMGRKVEQTMVHFAVDFANRREAKRIEATIVPTAKNQPCREFWNKSGFELDGENTFSWRPAQAYPLPEGVQLIIQ
jgi:FkbH-like protein